MPWRLLFKASALTLLMVTVALILSAGVIAWWGYHYLSVFSAQWQAQPRDVWELYHQAKTTTIPDQDGAVTFLLLGTDSLKTRGDVPPLTDTMMIVSVQPKTGKIVLLPLPRDLWSESQLTRINALYAYGQERDQQHPTVFPTTVISELTGTPVDYTIVVTLDQVAALIDQVGGVEVNVEEGFTDTEFPRPDVDVTTVTDPNLLYQTISFAQGTQHMSGEQVLQYIRSRHSTGDQGSDTARSKRQQAVLAALASTILKSESLFDPKHTGNLVKFYREHYASAFSLPELGALALKLWPQRHSITLVNSQLPIFPMDPAGVIIHPPTSTTQNQWVYTVIDPAQFKQYVQAQLYPL